MELDTLIPIAQAKPATGLGRVSLYRQAKAGKIKLTQIAGRTFVKASEARRFVETEGRTIGRQPDEAA